MSLRGIAGIVGLVAAALLTFSALSKGWYTASRGDESLGVGPMWIEECDGSRCESELLMKGASGDELELFAGAGLAFAGLASITSLLLVIFGILALTGHGARATGITAIVFVVLTNIAGGAFAGLKPERLSELTSSLGLFLSSFGGMAGIAFGIMMIVAARKLAAQAGAAAYGAPPGYAPPGAPPGYAPQPYPQQPGMPQPYPQQPVPAPGYPAGPTPQGPPGTPPQAPPGYPGPGYPPQGKQG